jgi:hypothetical protein
MMEITSMKVTEMKVMRMEIRALWKVMRMKVTRLEFIVETKVVLERAKRVQRHALIPPNSAGPVFAPSIP